LLLNAQTLHLILVADTDATYFGQQVQNGTNYFKNKFAPTLTERMNLNNVNVIANVDIEEIYQIKTNPDDVIVFYYCGYGFNMGGNDNYPVLLQFVYQNPKVTFLRDIYNQFKHKPHKLLLVIAETSNTVEKIKANAQTPINIQGDQVYGQNYMISSSSRGQHSSYCNTMDMGIFTQSFAEVFETATSLSWRNILDNTVSKTKQLAGEIGIEQTPQWEMN
jgi:hypothetical protein